MKVAMIGNTNIANDVLLWKDRLSPAQYAWGATHLNKFGIEYIPMQFIKYKMLNNFGSKIPLGYFLDQQVRLLINYRNYDLLFSAIYGNTGLLSLARSKGVYNKPIVILQHHMIKKGIASKNVIRSYDKILFLSSWVMSKMQKEFNLPSHKIMNIEFGVDIDFYDDAAREASGVTPEFFLSAGKTFRDYDTLIAAFRRLNYPLKIYCSGNSAPKTVDIPQNVKVYYSHPYARSIQPKELLTEYINSIAVTIPLIETDYLVGLGSLLEAMAMGKAILMTRNPCIDIDIEKEGFGIWINPRDTEGWLEASQYIVENTNEARIMGEKARRLCKEKYNIHDFSRKLSFVFQSVYLN